MILESHFETHGLREGENRALKGDRCVEGTSTDGIQRTTKQFENVKAGMM